MAVYQLKWMFLNQVIAPITMLLLPLTLCVQESDTKLFQLISHYTNQFVLTVAQGYFYLYKLQSHPSLVLPTKHVHCQFRMRRDSFWAHANVISEPLQHSRKWYIKFDWEIVIVGCSCGGGGGNPVESFFYFYLKRIRIISKSEVLSLFGTISFNTQMTQNTICCTLLVLDSVICVRGGIGSTGQIVTPWQMRSVYLWNCSQSCKTDLLNTDELEPIQCDTLKITLVQT